MASASLPLQVPTQPDLCQSLVLSVVGVLGDSVRVTQGPQALAGLPVLDVALVAAQDVDVPVLEREWRATSSSLMSCP